MHAESISGYFKAYAALIVLTLLTVLTAYVNFGMLNILITILIAGIKTAVILIIFMHVKQSGHYVKVFVAAGFLWLALLLTILMSDYMTRHWDQPESTPTWIREDAAHFLREH